MGPPTENDPEMGNIRVRNVTPDRFEFQFDEWDYLDGVHGTETFSFLVMEGSSACPKTLNLSCNDDFDQKIKSWLNSAHYGTRRHNSLSR